MPWISLIAFSTASDSSSSESAIVTISAFSPNAIGSSLASLKTPDSNDSTFSLIFVFSSSRFTSKSSGIILNWIAAVLMGLRVRILCIYILLIGFGIGRILGFLLRILGMGILRSWMFLCCSWYILCS